MVGMLCVVHTDGHLVRLDSGRSLRGSMVGRGLPHLKNRLSKAIFLKCR